METQTIQASKKEAIQFLYDSLINRKQFDRFSEIISDDYTNSLGGKGVNGFRKTVSDLYDAFPDAQWKLEAVIADGNQVVVKQKFTGTQKKPFQNIAPTNREVAVNGIIIYEFSGKKIVHSYTQTDRIGFLQQLGVLTPGITQQPAQTEGPPVYFIDKFLVPKSAMTEFMSKTTYNRNFIKSLPGFISDQILVEQGDHEDTLAVMTIAAWESQDKINAAKALVQSEYKRIGFDPAAFCRQLNIKLERSEYAALK